MKSNRQKIRKQQKKNRTRRSRVSKLKTVDSILQTVGDTPLVRLNRVVPKNGCELYGKLEARNPAGSVKDRIGASMIRAAEADGRLSKGMTIVEPTSGNTGISLAMAAAALGYCLVLTMPDSMSLERRQVMASYGAQIVLTPGELDMPGAIRKADEIKAADPARVFIPQQFANPANPEAHRQSTAREILAAVEGKLDAFITGVGTGGTITGVGSVLKQALPDILLIAVEPKRSPVISGGEAGLHGIQGIGAGFVPEVLDRELIDEVVQVEDEQAFHYARRLAREEGLLLGPSSGANVAASIQVAATLAP
ncbi:MAG TPA: cysteine synthase A, partial [Candidatus Latescibacteria bacterium]|nr:cysteine synthase A [Candidatus Latescibacterota bacterium]